MKELNLNELKAVSGAERAGVTLFGLDFDLQVIIKAFDRQSLHSVQTLSTGGRLIRAGLYISSSFCYFI